VSAKRTSPRNKTSGNNLRVPGGLPSSERVYRDLKDAILANELPPNTRLVEVQVANELGVSRTPVREALKRLLAEGFVARDPLGGLIVRDAAPGEVDEAYPVREVLDGLASRLAARRITPEELIKLRVIHKRMCDAVEQGNLGQVVTINIAFHEAIYEIAGNRRLVALGRELREFVRRFSEAAYIASPERMSEVVKEHEAVLATLEGSDPDAAEAAARQHLRAARAHMTELRAAEELAAGLRSAG
jgi:DNA-binding GntR family transcriptional regulator